MIALFPNLIHLDDRAVTDDQRKEALRLYKRPLLERIISKTALNMPDYLRSASEKVSGMITPVPNYAAPHKNIIV